MKHELAKVFTLGVIQGEDEWLQLKLEHLVRHVCIWGSTGVGKTMIALMFMRQLVSLGIGFTFITPHPDGREKLLQWCDLSKISADRIVDVTPGTDCCPSLDPFADMPSGLNRLQEENWLQSECKRFIAAMLSNVPLADQEVMNQLNTWLMNSLYLCGKRVDGEYLGVDKALMLFDVDHPDFEPTMGRLLPACPDYMRADWNVYRQTKNVNQRRAMVQSTVNRYRRSTHVNPVVMQMFARRARAVRNEDVIENSMIQIVSVPECDDLPREAGQTVARMRLNAMLAAAKRIGARVPEHRRKYHFLIVDEFENFISEDARTGFQESRKFRTPFVVMMQGTSCAQKGEMDLLSKVTNECGIQATGQQQDPETLDYLADAFSAPFLNHTPLTALQALPVGHEIIQTQSVVFNTSRGMSVGEANAMTQTRSVTKQRHTGQSTQQSVALALSSSHAEGRSEGSAVGGSTGVSHGSNWSQGTGTSRQVTDSVSQGNSESSSVTNSTTESQSFSESSSSQITNSSSNGTTETASTGQTDGDSSSTSRSGEVAGPTRSISRNEGSSSSTTASESRGNTSSTTSGSSQGQSSTVGGSTGTGRSEGQTVGVTNTVGRAVSEGVKTQESVGGSTMTSQQETWSANQGRSSTDTSGVTRTLGGSQGSSSGESSGQTNGQSFGHTDNISASRSEGVAIGYNQVPLAQHQIIERPTGSLVVSVADQVSRFKTCIASLPDRVMLVKVRGMNRPFLLKVHHVADPYDQKKMFVCEEWRAFRLKLYVAKIRKAHPWYFLPSLEDEAAPAPAPRPRDRRKKHPEMEESPLL